MTPARWKDIVDNALDNFEVEDRGKDHYDDYGGTDIEYIIFSSPLGRVKLEYVERPLILDKKSIYSNRIGSEANVKYIYSETEKIYKLNAYKWDEDLGDWQEIDSNNFN